MNHKNCKEDNFQIYIICIQIDLYPHIGTENNNTIKKKNTFATFFRTILYSKDISCLLPISSRSIIFKTFDRHKNRNVLQSLLITYYNRVVGALIDIVYYCAYGFNTHDFNIRFLRKVKRVIYTIVYCHLLTVTKS